MAIKKKKLSELALFSSVVGLFTVGIDGKNKSVKIPLQSVFEAAEAAGESAQRADTAADTAQAAASSANTEAAGANAAKVAATEVSAALATNPAKIIDNYWHTFDVATKTYNNTGVYCRGEGFTIKRFYTSVEEMVSDFANPQVAVGEVVGIRTSVEVEDNAKIYVKVADEAVKFEFWLDMSGAIGFTGKTPQFSVGGVLSGAEPSLTITGDGFDETGNPKFKFNLVLPKGEKGDKGTPFTYSDLTEEQKDDLTKDSVSIAGGDVSDTVSTFSEEGLTDESSALASGDPLKGFFGKIAYQLRRLFETKLDKESPALAPARTVAKVRAVDDQGQSVSLTPAQTSALVLTDANKARIQQLSGIDYSNTTEQLVPGEFWPDFVTGQPKQVYTRTFSGTTIPGGSDFMGTLVHLLPVEYIDKGELCAGSTIGNLGPCVFTSSAGTHFNNNVYWNLTHKATIGAKSNISEWGTACALVNKPYRITLKYTKA